MMVVMVVGRGVLRKKELYRSKHQQNIGQRSQQALWYSHSTCFLLRAQTRSSGCMVKKGSFFIRPLHKLMKREETSSGTTDESKRALMRREGCGYYNKETISKPQIVCAQKGSLKTLLPLLL